MTLPDNRGEHKPPHQFDAISSIEFSRNNILNSASFRSLPFPALPHLPPFSFLRKGVNRFIKIILQEGQP